MTAKEGIISFSYLTVAFDLQFQREGERVHNGRKGVAAGSQGRKLRIHISVYTQEVQTSNYKGSNGISFQSHAQ